MRSCSRMLLTLCAVLPFLAMRGADAAAVMSVDLGAEWIKVGIVSHGVPMEIVLNKESKRKTPAVVALRDGIRTFGEDAVSVGVRFPKNSYKYVLDLLGKPYDHPVVAAYMERFPYYDIRATETGRVVFHHDDEITFTPEEIIAQMLGKAKEMAETNAGHSVNEVVISIPGFFNQAERRAVLEAATLANLRVLQLINDYTAIAINYGIFRRKEINETASYSLFFDMGALSTKAALVEYKLVKTKERGYVETVPQLQIVGVAYDRTLGGLEMTWRLREHLIAGWRAQGGEDPRGNPRAMEKLLKEAERLKNVLSANTEHYAQIESLIGDKDFRLVVTRSELEELCQDLWGRARSVITRALAAAGGAGVGALGVVAGGAARVPGIQQTLRDTLGHEPSRGINADEAATLGASYRAASLAKGYKVAPLQVRDAVILPVQVTFTRRADGQEKLVRRTLFGPMNPYPQKKVITFNKHTSDFSFNVNYAELDHLPSDELQRIGSLNLSRVELSGVADAIAKHSEDKIEQKGVKAHFSMDDSGVLSLINVEWIAEKAVTEDEDAGTLSKLGSTISKLFSSEEQKPEEPERNDTAKNETDKVPDKASANDTKEAKPKIVVLKEQIESREEVVDVKPATEEELKKSKAKIAELDLIDRKRAERETALNNLESHVIDMQVKLDMEEYAQCATPEEIEEVKKMCAEISEWLYDDGYDAPTELYQEKLAELTAKTEPILYKHWEHRERPDAIIAMRNMLNQTRHFLTMVSNNTKETNPDRDVFTNVEVKVLETKIQETEKWLNESIAEQGRLKKNEPVKLTVDSIRDKMGALDREVKYLLNKMKIWRPKKPAPAKTDNQTDKIQSDSAEETAAKPEGETGKTENKERKEKNKTKAETEAESEQPEVPELEGTNDVHTEL